MSRTRFIPYSADSAVHLCEMIEFAKAGNCVGIRANFNIARTTAQSLNIINQVILACGSEEFLVHTYRGDIADWPNDINQDQHLIWQSNSSWFIKESGHHLSTLPTSVTDLPFISCTITESRS